LLLGFERMIASSIELVIFGARKPNANSESRMFSVELPSGHSAAGYLLAVASATTLAKLNGSEIVDQAGIYTPELRIAATDFVIQIRAGRAGTGRNELREAVESFQPGKHSG
jgi:hypothetical protein